MLTRVTPSEDDVFDALRSFLLTVMPAGTAQFEGSVAAGVLTVASLLPGSGALAPGDAVLGLEIPFGVTVLSQTSGTTGGVGMYALSSSFDVGSTDVPVVMANGVEVILAQYNRVAEPAVSDFVTMTPSANPRLATDIDTLVDCAFTASVAGTLMTVSAVDPAFPGTINQGASVFGPLLAPGTSVVGFGTGTGGGGTYNVTPSQTAASGLAAAGQATKVLESQFTVQLDFHGPNGGNFARIVSALFRDEYGYDVLTGLNPAVSPLFADDPRQVPFMNAEQQFEDRWTLDAQLQVNFTVTVAQQAAAAAIVGVVDASTFPL